MRIKAICITAPLSFSMPFIYPPLQRPPPSTANSQMKKRREEGEVEPLSLLSNLHPDPSLSLPVDQRLNHHIPSTFYNLLTFLSPPSSCSFCQETNDCLKRPVRPPCFDRPLKVACRPAARRPAIHGRPQIESKSPRLANGLT